MFCNVANTSVYTLRSTVVCDFLSREKRFKNSFVFITKVINTSSKTVLEGSIFTVRSEG